MNTLRVHSIFTSIDGEVNTYHQGRVSTFLRLAGCNLRCSYCDTERAQLPTQGEVLAIEEVAQRIEALGVRKLTITGGEPLLQREGLSRLLYKLKAFEGHHRVTIETNGSLPPDPLLPVSYVMDYKLPSSGMEDRMNLPHFLELGQQDWLKFVVSDRQDFDWALRVLDQLPLLRAGVAFSPASGAKGLPQALAGWMLEKKLDAVFSLQIHKLLWPEGETGDTR
jgi:7-carboxy-7-deazaguanine synthase